MERRRRLAVAPGLGADALLRGVIRRRLARRGAAHLGAAGAVFASVAALYSVVIRLSYGAFPDYGQFFHYQRLYYLAGYYKTPLTPPTTWVLVALVYLAGLAYAAFALASRRQTPRALMVFLLSILGVGLSSYYQGSSNPIVLFLVWWPCQLLLVLFLDDLLLRLREKPASLLPWLATAALAWFLVGSAVSVAPDVGLVANVIGTNYRRMLDPKAPRQHQEEAAVLAQIAPPGEKVVVAAPYSALVHLRSKTPAANSSSLFQMVLMDEFRDMEESLAKSPSGLVLVDKNTFSLIGWQANDRGLRNLIEFLEAKFELATATTTSYVFTRRRDDLCFVDGDEPAALHVSIREGAAPGGLTFAPMSSKPPWSLEMLVKPGAEQGPNAALVGNHPGGAVGGFVIQQSAPGIFALFVGDGKTSQNLLHFRLLPGQWNYPALVRSQDAFTLYLDGTPVGFNDSSDLPMRDSPLPLQVGNWVGNDRPFNGEVKEVRVLNRALTAKDIAAAAAGVREKLP